MTIKKENRFYDVFPRIVPAYQTTVVTVHPRYDPFRFQESQTYRLSLVPIEGLPGEVQWRDIPFQSITPQDGDLLVPCVFDGEEEYLLVLRTDTDALVAEFHLYALKPDLISRKPYKGDTHMHTYYSDGKEAPAYLAASCRKIGMDFIAITDHRRYEPSLEAIRTFAGTPADLRIFPGEEVHPPENRVHMVNFGGKFSINALFSTDAYRTEVATLAETLTNLPEGIDRYPFASCKWCFDKIRQAGGLGIFCHPYWISSQRYDVPTTLTDLLFEHQPFDALELIGGYQLIGGYHVHEAEANVLQVARYHEERIRGKHIPIVGASDSHGCETGHLFGWYYTIAFSPCLDLPDLINSVKDEYSVAVEALPGELVRAFGPLRLVRYAQYLLREVFPSHDELCLEEGRLMLEHAEGSPQAITALQGLQGQTAHFYEHIYPPKII